MWHALILCGVLSYFVACPHTMFRVLILCGVSSYYVACPHTVWRVLVLCGMSSYYVACPHTMWHILKLRDIRRCISSRSVILQPYESIVDHNIRRLSQFYMLICYYTPSLRLPSAIAGAWQQDSQLHQPRLLVPGYKRRSFTGAWQQETPLYQSRQLVPGYKRRGFTSRACWCLATRAAAFQPRQLVHVFMKCSFTSRACWCMESFKADIKASMGVFVKSSRVIATGCATSHDPLHYPALYRELTATL